MNAILHNSFLSFAGAHGFDVNQELIIDCFAGGGGASEGMEMAMRDMRAAGLLPDEHRCAVDIAINHDPKAIAMHAANHPRTMHLTADIWTADPLTVTGGIAVGALWASPDCRGFSKAKGGAPVSKSVRSLAWIVAHWAEQVRPREIYLENVEEFQDWGDLDPKSRPDKTKKGQEFKRWVKRFKKMGYTVEWRVLRANEFGVPTIRKRLYIMMRCDGLPIVWAETTHGDLKDPKVLAGELWPNAIAADILDLDRPCPSIFMTRADAREFKKETGIQIQRPLAFNSEARIAKGTWRYVVNAEPEDRFITTLNHGGSEFRGQGMKEPFRTVAAARDAHGVVVPQLAQFISYGQHGGRSRSALGPVHTIEASVKDTNQLVSVFLNRHTTGAVGSSALAAAPTVTANSFRKRPGGASPLGATAVYLVRQFGNSVGRSALSPAGTVTAGGGGKTEMAAIFLAQNNTGEPGNSARRSLSTIVGKGSTQSAVSAHMMSLKGSDRRSYSALRSVEALTAKGQHASVVLPFLQAYYGADQDTPVTDPLHSITTKARFSLAQAEVSPPPLSEELLAKAKRVADFLRKYGCWDGGDLVTVGDYVIVDIGMRMLTPRELARAQGFRESYILAAPFNGGFLTETDQRHKIGNSVCPDMAYVLFRNNYRPRPRLVVNNDQGWLFSAPSTQRAAA